MRKLVVALGLLALPSFATEPILISLKENDSAVVILDRETPDHVRPEVVIPPTESPGRVIVERRPDPDPKDWTEVRWVIRFDLSKVPASIQQARLHLWCQQGPKSLQVPPKLELIADADPRRVVSADRASQPVVAQAVPIPFPSQPSMVEVDVTALVQAALKQKLSFAAFRISAVCDPADCRTSVAEAYYFGGYTNVWSWPQSEPPLLEITP
jgi:hypothetical protein